MGDVKTNTKAVSFSFPHEMPPPCWLVPVLKMPDIKRALNWPWSFCFQPSVVCLTLDGNGKTCGQVTGLGSFRKTLENQILQAQKDSVGTCIGFCRI